MPRARPRIRGRRPGPCRSHRPCGRRRPPRPPGRPTPSLPYGPTRCLPYDPGRRTRGPCR
ncbi:hypothetical protein CP977_32395 [Streptomyces cinereoruber]|uniref:Uncharacterized protein n=1 Tax=Streptomyces cinereoruber TaxID=67260 RepID=A0ABX6BLY8_9ACTN|nr:hypothetical protein CP977_32395 [Streptomyces cinereoruber]